VTAVAAAVHIPEARLRHEGSDAVSAAARAVAREWSTHAQSADWAASLSAQNIEWAWAAGLGNPSLPAQVGGVGAALGTTAQAVRILPAGDPSSALANHLRVEPELGTPARGGVPATRADLVQRRRARARAGDQPVATADPGSLRGRGLGPRRPHPAADPRSRCWPTSTSASPRS
jgi:hypothetical protein